MKLNVQVMVRLLEDAYKLDAHEYTLLRRLYVNMGYKISVSNGKHVIVKDINASLYNPYFWRGDRYKENIIGYLEYLYYNNRPVYNKMSETLNKVGCNVKYCDKERKIIIED